MSQDRLAALIDVSQATVSAWERDKDLPRRSRVPAIERAVGVQPGELVAAWNMLPEGVLVSNVEEEDARTILARIKGDVGRLERLLDQ